MNLLFSPGGYYADYLSIGVGPGKLLSYGVFPQGTDSVNTCLLEDEGFTMVQILSRLWIKIILLRTYSTHGTQVLTICSRSME